MAKMKLGSAEWLAAEVVSVLEGVVLHQRSKWGTLLGHQHQHEAWWKAEMALALESWAWRQDLPGSYWPEVEAKPKNFGIGKSDQSVDILVAPFSEDVRRIEATAAPRVWVEIKERGTWWSSAAKGLAGLRDDLSKWSHVKWTDEDVLLVCQVLTHDDVYESVQKDEPFPESWIGKLDELAQEHTRRKAMVLGYPTWNVQDERCVRWARIDIFTVHPG